MQLYFLLNYRAVWGQALHIQIFDEQNQLHEYAMKCVTDDKWKISVKYPSEYIPSAYRYVIKNTNGTVQLECNGLRKFHTLSIENDTHFIDYWRDFNGESVFNTVAFTDCFFKRKKAPVHKKTESSDLTLQLHCPQMESDRHFAIIGNQPMLGNWDVNKKIRLDESEFPIWSIKLNSKEIKFPLEYKYLIVDTKTDEVLAWGGGPNRLIKSVEKNTDTVVTDENLIRTIPSFKTAGVALPMFSLRSEEGFGTGEFLDMIKLIDWAKQTGQRIIQTLPINDTILYHTNYDSYPYNAVSVYALHPIYLRMEQMGTLKDKKIIEYFKEKKELLNKNKFSDYQNVLNEKWKYFKAIFAQESANIFESEDYKLFFEKNKVWLVPYAAFSYLRDINKTPEFGKWKKYKTYHKEEIEEFSSSESPHYKEIAFYYFLQYHLHIQLTEVRNYAHKNGIAIKSDVPIGVSPRSVDAWVEPQLFNTNMQAGAPPDDFSVTGQNWGFPTYNWEEMEKDGYQWWKKRFQKFVEYFDAYRIDHILGFFRIWEIPEKDVWALTGSFNPALPYSTHELQHKGLWWDEERFLKPYLKEHVIRAIFGKYAEDVMREYLVINGWQSFKFKPEFDTQKKIEAHFSSLGYNFTNKEIAIRDGLYELHCQVIFVKDNRRENMFHPRISMHSSYSFRDLPDHTRKILDSIYIEYFYHRHNEFWKEQALKKLPALISATNMLVCGEDLGMVPSTVPEVMRQLEMISLEIQRMPKKPNVEFAMPADAPYLSVCTTSTHDMNPIRAWWEENPAIIQRFYNRALGISGPAPEHCSAEIAERIVKQHLDSTAMLVILPWQDWMATNTKLRLKDPNAERINIPADPRNFWCYRMHLTLEKLLSEKKFNAKLKKMIQESGR
ncbi:4-alpha-glucanotransferase [uncultured Paludibacter sp.]|nr:4-alpha-glucanotransferase [uncultured Paludibacter sp.]